MILDSFTEGSFDLRHSGLSTDISSISGPLANLRSVNASGGNWQVTLAEGTESIVYSSGGLGSRPYSDWINLNYRNDNNLINLIEYNAFRFDVSSIQGNGFVAISASPTSSMDIVMISINDAGFLYFSFADVATSMSFEELTRINIRIYASSPDFSITLNEIAVVPELSSLLLLGSGAIPFLWRRRTPGNSVPDERS